MTHPLIRSTGRLFFFKLSIVVGGLLFFTGCYTQLHTASYSEREPDHQTITEFETEYGDSVVVDNYYYEDGFYHYHPRMNRYRRHFSTFHGYPYAVSPFYDPFYDDYWYGGSSIHLNFGWGSPYLYSPINYGWYNPYQVYVNPYFGGGWGYGYYGHPLIYHSGLLANYGPRSSRIGRRGVQSRRGSQRISNQDDMVNSRRSVAHSRPHRGSELAQSRTRRGAIDRSVRTRGVQRQAVDEPSTRSTRRGVTRNVSGDGVRGNAPARSRNNRTDVRSRSTTRSSSSTRTRSAPQTRTRSSSGTRTRSAPQTRTRSSSGTRTRSASQTRTRSSSGTRTRSASQTRTRSSSGTRTRSAPQTRTRSSSGTRTRSAPQTRTRSSSGTRTRSAPQTRTRSSSGTRTRSAPQTRTRSSSGTRTTRSAPQTRTRSSSGTRTRSAPQTRSTPKKNSSSGGSSRSNPPSRKRGGSSLSDHH